MYSSFLSDSEDYISLLDSGDSEKEELDVLVLIKCNESCMVMFLYIMKYYLSG